MSDVEDEAEEMDASVVTQGQGEEEDHGRGLEGFGGCDEGEGGGCVVAAKLQVGRVHVE